MTHKNLKFARPVLFDPQFGARHQIFSAQIGAWHNIINLRLGGPRIDAN